MSDTSFPSERNFFESLPQDVRQAVRKSARAATYKAGALIHQSGDAARALSVIVAGTVRMSNVTVSGERVITAQLAEGESFGIFPLLSGGPRSHDAHAYTDARILELSQPAFKRLMDQTPDLRDDIIAHLTRRLIRALEAVEDERRYPLKIRLAKLLARRAQSSPIIFTTQSALADELGVSRYGIGLALKDMIAKGILETGYGEVRIVEPTRLGALAD